MVTDSIIELVYSRLLLAEVDHWSQLHALLNQLPAHQRRTFLYSLLRTMPKTVMNKKEPSHENENIKADPGIGRAAALIAGILTDSSDLTDALVTWLTGASGGGIGQDVRVCRAALAALSNDLGKGCALVDGASTSVLTRSQGLCKPYWRKACGLLGMSYISNIHQSYNKKVHTLTSCSCE